jgi:HEAT repeat protein
MSNDVGRYIERLRQRREAPVQGIIAATALGRQANLLREKLIRPAPMTLGVGEADDALKLLTCTFNDMDVSSQQRAAAAWALGQIGGIEPARQLINRLEGLFVQREAAVLGLSGQGSQEEARDVCATLVQALTRALDEAAVRTLDRFDLQRLRILCNALLDHLPKETDPDLSTALAMSLGKLAWRVKTGILRDVLHELLHAPEPIATLATIGVLTELIPDEQQDKVLDYLYDMKSNATVDDAFGELESECGRLYRPDERGRLLQLTVQSWYTERVTKAAGEHMWKEIAQSIL